MGKITLPNLICGFNLLAFLSSQLMSYLTGVFLVLFGRGLSWRLVFVIMQFDKVVSVGLSEFVSFICLQKVKKFIVSQGFESLDFLLVCVLSGSLSVMDLRSPVLIMKLVGNFAISVYRGTQLLPI